jgi:hypothetical protein
VFCRTHCVPIRSLFAAGACLSMVTACGAFRGVSGGDAPATPTINLPPSKSPPFPYPIPSAPPATIECDVQPAGTYLKLGVWIGKVQQPNPIVQSGDYQGDIAEQVVMTNVSTSACFLPTPPDMVVNLAAGGEEAVSVGDFAGQRVDVQPGQVLQVGFGSPGYCSAVGTVQNASSVTMTLPGGDSVTVSGFTLDVGCGSPAVLLFDALDASSFVAGPQASLPPSKTPAPVAT